ncbi:MAG: recombinase family protein [Parvibaculum sp.]
MTTSSDGKSQPRVMQRAALYLRVSTARQAEHDVSIPDQKRQGEAYCEARGLSFDSGMGVGRDLTLTFGLGRGQGLGL